MTCNDFDCALQQVAAIEAGTLVAFALSLPLYVYGFHLWYRWWYGYIEKERRYKIGLETRPSYYHLRQFVSLGKLALICGIPLTIIHDGTRIFLPEDFARLQPLKWIL